MLLAGVHLKRNCLAVRQPQCSFKAFSQALSYVVKISPRRIGHTGQHAFSRLGSCWQMPHLEAVNHHVNVVLLGFLELGQVVEFIGCAVYPKAHIALRLHFGKHVHKFALALARHWRQDHQPGVFRQGQHMVDHFADALSLQRQIVNRAKRRAGARKQQTQVVMDLGHCADGGARVVAGGFLLDRDGR